jgi:hypothetical protein
MSKPILVIIHLKSILIQTIQTKNIENHFYISISKHKSILFNSLLTKINSIKLNSVKINSIHRQTKHILSLKIQNQTLLNLLILTLDTFISKFDFLGKLRNRCI